MTKLLSIPLLAAGLISGRGAVLMEEYIFTPTLTPTDGLGLPATDTRTIESNIDSLTSVVVSLRFLNPEQGGAFNGDYYVSLQHSSGFSVLLNRVGRREGAPLGYDDNGFNITFSDTGSSGDIHIYRNILSGDHGTPIDPTFIQPLTGVWQPDGRNVSPLIVLDTDARAAMLNVFNNLNADGSWSLQAIDFNSGGTATIDRWGLTLVGTGVPEPEATIAAAAFALCAFAFLKKIRK